MNTTGLQRALSRAWRLETYPSTGSRDDHAAARVVVRQRDGLVVEFKAKAPAEGGHVRLDEGEQLCRRFDDQGQTLTWSPHSGVTLAEALRREWKLRRKRERRSS